MLTNKASELEKLNRVDELWESAREALFAEGIEYVIYITVDGARENPFVLTNVPGVYEGAPPTDDPFIEWCCRSYDVTCTGPNYLDEYEYLPEAAKEFIVRASKTGFKSGLAIPMRLQGTERFGGFNLGTGLDRETFEKRILPKAEEFRFFCLLIHRRLEELGRTGLPHDEGEFRDLLVAPDHPDLVTLSPREREVIYLVAQGISRKECARLCGISPNTVAEYTKSAYRKLGVQNRVEVARLVMRQAS